MPTVETSICTSEDPAQIRAHAETLMRRHGVAGSWDFAWMPRAKKALGMCDPALTPALMQGEGGHKGEIKLSRKLFVDLGMETMMEYGVRKDLLTDTILHEIAHARDFEARGTSDHSFSWKTQAREVGAEPTRCEQMPHAVRLLTAKWVRFCPQCDRISRLLYRKPGPNARRRSCGHCTDSFDPTYELEIRKNEQQVL